MECPICQENLTTEIHSLECGHKFHSECIISWFRSGSNTCPCCRDTNCELQKSGTQGTFMYVRRLSKMSSCPRFLKDVVEDYDNIKKEIKQLKHEINLFKCSAEGRYHVITSEIVSRERKLKAKIKMLKRAKKKISSASIFIVPIKKKIFI